MIRGFNVITEYTFIRVKSKSKSYVLTGWIYPIKKKKKTLGAKGNFMYLVLRI